MAQESKLVSDNIQEAMEAAIADCSHLHAEHAATVVNGERDGACRGTIEIVDRDDQGNVLSKSRRACECEGYEKRA